MKTDQAITNPVRVANPEYLNAMRELSTEEERELDRATEKLDQARFAKVMRMTATAFGKLSPPEKRNYVRWATGFRKVFEQQERMFIRNSPPEPALPADLQAR